MQGLKCHPSRPPVPEERQINRLHAEVVKKRKDAAEATAERKRKRKAKHDKACKIARAEGKPRPATPESTDEEEEASDAEGHLLGDDGAVAGASSPPTYQWDADEGASTVPEETRTAAESSADPSLEGAERESWRRVCGGRGGARADSPEAPGRPEGDALGTVFEGRRGAVGPKKRSMSARSG